MKTSTGRKMTMGTLLTLLLAGSVLTVGSTTVPPPTTPKGPSCSRVANSTLARNVEAELAKTMTPRVMGDIQITAKHRVVTLTGVANYLGTKALAAKLARKVACVTRVINKITYRRPAQECDGGFQNCCCPENGCECSKVCPVCGNPKVPKPGGPN